MPAMAYPYKLLNPGESVVVELHPHWSVLARPAAGTLLAGGGAIWLLFAFPSMSIWLAGALGAVLAAVLGWLAVRWLQRASTTFAVTTQRVALRGGLLVKKGWDIRLDRINDVSFDQSFSERLLGVGDLWVDTGGEAGMKGMARMPHPQAVRQLIFEKQESQRTAPASSPTSPPVTVAPAIYPSAGLSVAEQLEKLDELRRRGVITDEEFDAEKSRLIGL